MRGLSFIEILALLFTGVAGLASAVQAYVSYETRGEVGRAIVFAERIEACAAVMAAIEPFRNKARSEGRAVVAKGAPDGRYSLAGFYYGSFAGSASMRPAHETRVAAWRRAWAQFSIVLPAEVAERGRFFDRAITEDFLDQSLDPMSQADLLAWLERYDREAEALFRDCRAVSL